MLRVEDILRCLDTQAALGSPGMPVPRDRTRENRLPRLRGLNSAEHLELYSLAGRKNLTAYKNRVLREYSK